MGDLQGKVVVVTGGSRGIGMDIARGALAEGARVAVCARNPGQPGDPARTPDGGTETLLVVRGDVSHEQDVETLFDRTLAAYGRVDVVVNNAGAIHDELAVSMSAQSWDDVMATNLTGAFLVARRAVREFLAQGDGGALIAVGSVSQNGAISNAGYAASKGGLAGLARAIAADYGRAGVRVHTVVCGFVETQMTRAVPPAVRQGLVEMSPHKRAAAGAEIASVVLALASGRARVANGDPIYVSGGLAEAPVYLSREKAV